MKRRILLVTAALLMMGAVAPSALADAPDSFTATGFIAVTHFTDITPAGASGRVKIGDEGSFGGLVSGPAGLAGNYLTLQQKSNELFDSDPQTNPFAVAINGSSVGTFAVIDPGTGATVASGQYHLNVSNVPGCQIYDQGEWSTTGSSGLTGHGTVVACLNFDFGLLTFDGPITFSGSLQP